MNVAELFVNIGVTGGDKAAKELSGIQRGLSDIETSGLAAKAALVGLFYMAERALTGAAKFGADLKVLTGAFDIDPAFAQNWRYAMSLVNVTADQADQTLVGLSKTIGQIKLTGEVPKYFASIMDRLGIHDINEIKDLPTFLTKVQNLIKNSPADKNLMNDLFASMSISPQVRQGLERLKKPVDQYKDPFGLGVGQDNALAALDVQWNLLIRRITKFAQDFAAKDGKQIVTALDNTLSVALKLADAFERLWKASDGFKVAVAAIAAFFAPITAAVLALIWVSDQWEKKEKNQPSIFGTGKNEDIPGWMKWGDNFLHDLTMDPTSTVAKIFGTDKRMDNLGSVFSRQTEGGKGGNTLNMNIYGEPSQENINKMKNVAKEIVGGEAKTTFTQQKTGLKK